MEPQPSPQPSLSTEEGERGQFNPESVGKNIEDSADVLDLPPHSITVRQVKVQYIMATKVFVFVAQYGNLRCFTLI